MNPLAALKEKLMVKPNIEERERVAVVIKGVKKQRKPRAPKTKVEEVEEGEEQPEKTNKPKLVLEEVDSEEEQEQKNAPLIVDETQKGFDRDAILKKLVESKKIHLD